MERNDADSFLLDTIGDYLNAIQECVTFLNTEEVESFQKCITNLFCFYKEYSEGWKSLIHSIDPDVNKNGDDKLELLHERFQLFLKGSNQSQTPQVKMPSTRGQPKLIQKNIKNKELSCNNVYLENDNSSHKTGKLLLDKIHHLIKGIEDCILELSVQDFLLLQNTITHLFDLHHEYIRGWDRLNHSLKPDGYTNFQEYIESDEYQKESSSYSTDKKMKEIAYEMFMGNELRLG